MIRSTINSIHLKHLSNFVCFHDLGVWRCFWQIMKSAVMRSDKSVSTYLSAIGWWISLRPNSLADIPHPAISVWVVSTLTSYASVDLVTWPLDDLLSSRSWVSPYHETLRWEITHQTHDMHPGVRLTRALTRALTHWSCSKILHTRVKMACILLPVLNKTKRWKKIVEMKSCFLMVQVTRAVNELNWSVPCTGSFVTKDGSDFVACLQLMSGDLKQFYSQS